MVRSLVSNPPYNMPWTPPALAGFLPQFRGVEIPPKNNANYAFILTALSEIVDGRAALLLPNSVLTPTGKERNILETLIKENVVDAAIMTPDRMFESTQIPTCVLVLNTNRQTRKIALIDLRNSAQEEVREQRGQYGGAAHTNRVYKKTVNVLTPEVMQKAADAIANMTNEPGFSVAVEPERIAEQDYALIASRYMPTEQDYVSKHRPFEDIAADYNRIIRVKNSIQVKINKTAAKTLGLNCLEVERPDLTDSFAVVGQKAEKEKYVTFSADDGIVIRCGTKGANLPILIENFLREWTLMIRALNNEENRLLAEFRDALLPELMSGKIEV